ncbi:MAG TPA: ArsC/Spx/MgsR family protein [Acidimicrobiales bacterium]|jgi:arsenate reductase|nr:ArsC/Spx/MgsR family protein [Acidimicrobiales bacterium]
MSDTDSDAEPITIFHNPKCSKSRGALELVDAQGTKYHVIEYLKAPPDRSTLEHIVGHYEGPLVDLVRTGDAGFTDLDIDPATLTTPDAVVEVLLDHPEVMQRPILVRGDAVVIARPPELVAQLLVD